MILNIRLFALALTIAFVLLLPIIASTQGLGTREENTSLNGTRLTYYQRPSVDQCQADCANNPNCKGYTWIQAGTYNAGDAAMCYLVSEVTGRASARGHISAVKGTAGGGGGTLTGDWNFSCCDGEFTGILRISSQEGATFAGSFENIQAGGAVRNGQVRGNRIDFDRIASGFQQHYSAELVNDGGRLKMINGVWSGGYQERGKTNWHAEKK